jgi:RNA polymerase sigma factor (TIGR02999 family)
VSRGERGASGYLDDLVYDELRRLADQLLGRARGSHTLQPTALVHEAYLKLAERGDWNDTGHFQAVAARSVRQVLVDYARHGNRMKRGGGARRLSLDTSIIGGGQPAADLLELHEALEALAVEDARAARIVELRFFGDLPMSAIAERLNTSLRTVERDWRFARAWLMQALGPHDEP